MRRPAISVVVPTRDRPAALGRCVRALRGQSVPVEVIVVDDRSAMPDAVRGAAAGATVLAAPGRGPAAARNAGIAAASGEVVCLIDDDCEPVAGWAELLAAGCGPTGTAAGRTLPPASAPAIARASQAIANGILGSSFDPVTGTVGFAPSCNLAIDAGLARELRFDERFPAAAGEDREWCDRAVAAGHAPRLVDAAIVVHHQRMTVSSFARQQLGYGRGAARYRALGPGGGRVRRGPALARRLLADATAEGFAVGALVALAQGLTVAGMIAERRSPLSERRRGPPATG